MLTRLMYHIWYTESNCPLAKRRLSSTTILPCSFGGKMWEAYLLVLLVWSTSALPQTLSPDVKQFVRRVDAPLVGSRARSCD